MLTQRKTLRNLRYGGIAEMRRLLALTLKQLAKSTFESTLHGVPRGCLVRIVAGIFAQNFYTNLVRVVSIQ
jgi:hypothetical protein